MIAFLTNLYKKLFPKKIIERQRDRRKRDKSCKYYPCHFKLEDCTFCYCPVYPCADLRTGGKFYDNSVWDCSDCNIIHNKEVMSKIKTNIRKIIKSELEKKTK